MSNRDAEIRNHVKAIEENATKLHNCIKHVFAVEDRANGVARSFVGLCFKCSVCGGEMPWREAEAYARGYKAAGGDPEEVFPGCTW